MGYPGPQERVPPGAGGILGVALLTGRLRSRAIVRGSPRRTERPLRGSSDAAAEEALSWVRMYEKTPYTQLPWYSTRASPWLARAVKSRWIRPPGPILDIGCGAGSNSLWLSSEGFSVTGLDLAPVAIAAAERRGRRRKSSARFRVGSALSMPFPSSRFAGALDSGCFHTIPLPDRVPVRRRSRAGDPPGRDAPTDLDRSGRDPRVWPSPSPLARGGDRGPRTALHLREDRVRRCSLPRCVVRAGPLPGEIRGPTRTSPVRATPGSVGHRPSEDSNSLGVIRWKWVHLCDFRPRRFSADHMVPRLSVCGLCIHLFAPSAHDDARSRPPPID